MTKPTRRDAVVAMDALILTLAHAAGHDPSDVAMPHRKELAQAAIALAGVRAARHFDLGGDPVTVAMRLVEDMEDGLLGFVRQLDALEPGTFARLLQPEVLFGGRDPFVFGRTA